VSSNSETAGYLLIGNQLLSLSNEIP